MEAADCVIWLVACLQTSIHQCHLTLRYLISTPRNMAGRRAPQSLESIFHISQSTTVIDFQRLFAQESCSMAQEDRSLELEESQIRNTKLEAKISRIPPLAHQSVRDRTARVPLSGTRSHVKRPSRPAAPMPEAIEQYWLWLVSQSVFVRC